MTSMQHVDGATLGAIIDAFRGLSWPADRDQMRRIAADLGWETVSDRRKGMDFQTGLAVTPDHANTLLPGDGTEIGQVQVYLSDRVSGDVTAAATEDLRSVYRTLADLAAETLGDPSAPRGAEGTYWDLPTGGRIAVKRLDKVVILDVVSEAYANIERAEKRLGVGTERVPGVDPEPA